jgi:peptidyl-prolyl cis-trans isomerase SurA
VVNAAYRFQRNLSEQVEVSWQWPLNDLWGDRGRDLGAGRGQGEGRYYGVGRMNYSMNERRLVDTILGVEYDAGCWLGRVVVQRIQTSASTATQSVMFQLEFVGFTKLGISPQRTVAAFRAQLRDQQMLSRLHEREVEARIRITEQDIDRYLQDQQANNTDPFAQEINLAQILIAVPEKASAAQAAALQIQAQKALDRIRGGEDFVRVMQSVSAADRANGGQLGLRRADRYPVSFVLATQKTEVGGVSEIVRSGAGFHILKVIEKRAPSVLVKTIEQSRAQHILLRPSAKLTQDAALAQLAGFKKKILAGTASFASLAREFSQDGSAAQGGDLGWVMPGMFVPEFEEVMNRLAEGEISNPVVSRFGVHLIQLVERRRVDLTPRELRDSVRAQLKEMRVEEAFSTWARDVRNRAFVEMREPPQ